MGTETAVRTCSITDCEHKHAARGYCQGHYQRFRLHGDPHGGIKRKSRHYNPHQIQALTREHVRILHGVITKHFNGWSPLVKSEMASHGLVLLAEIASEWNPAKAGSYLRFDHWLAGRLRLRLTDWLRVEFGRTDTSASRGRLFTDSLEEVLTRPDGGQADLYEHGVVQVTDHIQDRELLTEVAEAIQTLPPGQRTALLSRTWGMSSSEIGKILGIKSGSVSSVRIQALDRLWETHPGLMQRLDERGIRTTKLEVGSRRHKLGCGCGNCGRFQKQTSVQEGESA